MKNLLLIAGFNMIVPDRIPPTGFWSLAERLSGERQVRLRDCMESGPQEFKATREDILWADEIISYSYGKATEKKLIHELARDWPLCKTLDLITIVGVNDCWAWQVDFFGSLWKIEPFIKQACFFNIDVLGLISPASHPLRDPRAVEVRASAGQAIPPLTSPFINVNCNDLVKGLSEVEKHTTIKDHPLVLDAIECRLKGEC